MTYPHLCKRRHVSIQLCPTLTLICCPFFPPAFVEQPLFAPFGRSRNDWTSYFDAQLNCCHWHWDGQVCWAETLSSSNLSMVIIRKLSMFIQTMLHPFNMNLRIMIYILIEVKRYFSKGLTVYCVPSPDVFKMHFVKSAPPTSSPRHPNWLDGVNYSGQIGIEVATYQIRYCVWKYDEKNLSL